MNNTARGQQLNARTRNFQAEIGAALLQRPAGPAARVAAWILTRTLRLGFAWLRWRTNHHTETHDPASCITCRYRTSPDLAALERLVSQAGLT